MEWSRKGEGCGFVWNEHLRSIYLALNVDDIFFFLLYTNFIGRAILWNRLSLSFNQTNFDLKNSKREIIPNGKFNKEKNQQREREKES